VPAAAALGLARFPCLPTLPLVVLFVVVSILLLKSGMRLTRTRTTRRRCPLFKQNKTQHPR
jgi:hypothetical protein